MNRVDLPTLGSPTIPNFIWVHPFGVKMCIRDRIKNVVKLFDEIYSTFGLSYQIELSTMPEDLSLIHIFAAGIKLIKVKSVNQVAEKEGHTMEELRIITISREFGSGGRSIGKTLAQRLGIAYYDKRCV